MPIKLRKEVRNVKKVILLITIALLVTGCTITNDAVAYKNIQIEEKI